jgi:hypothetical protein
VPRLRRAHAEYTLDGEPLSMAEFLRPDVNEFDAEEIRRIVTLQPGQSIIYGGGAMALRVLRRES